ncbi:sugar ABC transporter ATP-binding protein [Fertoebacter nigrum]|uniref:Sugar ABC transporter ATP-binding protein n=1 Tax=Fertoeibacter niger TaxID=2656921 RepID=A0A8X8H2V4_9RHOB|nr:sugar ABC transporter ATP-binding protein [Fertoeibacter niger]NUB45284.1 sugar ABC transporter ATP-binding protein [Fertoeibacter niger]
MPHLALTGLKKTYGAARALNGAALDLRGGEVHALMGENGAGKSTLIRLLAGLERPDSGVIALDGTPLRLGNPAEAQAAGLRFLHQELQIFPGLSVAENMFAGRAYPLRAGLVHWRALRTAAAEALHRLDVTHIRPQAAMDALGPGDQMLVRIAATLLPGASTPWAYVMDEPTAALTGAEAERLFAAIAGLRARGAAVLYVSHRMDEVLRLADRVTVLRDGAHVSTRAIADTGQARIIAEMTGREMRDLYPPRGTATGTVVLDVAGLAAGALHDAAFTLRAGEVLGLAGLSGSGRNDLLKALIGAVPRRGRVTLDGAPLGDTPAACWAQGMAYVPRERRAEGVMLGRALGETVALPHLSRLSRGGFVNRRAEGAQVNTLAAQVRLKASGAAQPCGQLSGGNQQKVLFARALAGRPRVLLLDEPTRGVDVGARFDIYGLIRDAAGTGAAVLVASSDLPELIGLCDRIAILQAGHLTGITPAAGLTEAALLARCYGDTPSKDI